MIDGIIKGEGNSRLLKSPATIPTTFEEFRAALIAGTLPIDLLYNAAGWDAEGTPLNKANLFADTTAALLGLSGENATVNKALRRIYSLPDEIAALYGLSGDDANVDDAFIILAGSDLVAFTSNSTWVIPPGVTKIRLWGCASGSGVYAGGYVLGNEYTVTPGATMTITVGTGNTVLSGGGLAAPITLVAGSVAYSLQQNILGIVTGIPGKEGGHGGAFGFGGGHGGNGSNTLPGGSGGSGGPGGNGGYQSSATDGGNGFPFSIFNVLPHVKRILQLLPNLLKSAGGGGGGRSSTTVGTKGGNGVVNGGAAASPGTSTYIGGGGGGAGGYGAGGGAGGGLSGPGFNGNPGGASPGMALIAYNY